MADRKTNHTPNTRHPERPASHPSRLDQFADEQLTDMKNTNLEESEEEDNIVSFNSPS